MGYEENFKVDLSKLHLNRKKGISGMMRVRNDAEFIEACIESCIDALDELVIVYNDCSDKSPEIIKMMAERYPEKIIYYEYLPWLYCGSLTKDQYETAKNLPPDSVHLLSNYYNFALSKTTRKYVMKIDADQIYFTEKLINICKLYRDFHFSIPSPLELYSFYKIYSKFKHRTIILNDNLYRYYNNCIIKLIGLLGITTSYSGINLVHDKKDSLLVPLGKKTGKLNILIPYNGVGDHLIFKVRKNIHFIPYDCPEYNIQTTSTYTYIESLNNVGRYYINGFLWWHLNGMRPSIREMQNGNIKKYPESFINLRDFACMDYSQIVKLIDSSIFSNRNKNLFEICHNITAINNLEIIKKIKKLII